MQSIPPQGIRVEEQSASRQAIAGKNCRPSAFIGSCLRGPVNQPVLIQNLTEFENQFGAVSQDSTLSFAVRMFFVNGGRSAWVTRVARNAKPAGIELQAGTKPLCLWSVCAGSHEYIRAAVDYDGIETVDGDCFNLTIQRLARPQSETVIDQEIYRYISIARDHPNFVTHVLAGSQLVRADEDVPEERPFITLNHRLGKAEFFREVTIEGRNGGRITMADILGSSADRSGLFALTEQYDFEQLYIPPLSWGMEIGVPVLRAAARMCDRRRAVLIVDTPKSWSNVDNALELVDRFSLRGENVAMFYPWLWVTNPETGKAIEVPPGGAIAGVLDRCSVELGPGGTPAGHLVLIRGARRFSTTVNETQSYQLAQKGINSLRSSKGGRKVIWDSVLLTRNDGSRDQVRSLKVRRLMQYIAHSIEDGLQWTVFETNDENLWKKIKDLVNDFLLGCMNQGLLQGLVPDGAFSVTCDLETNPTNLRTRNKVGLVIEVAPIQPSRFVKLSFELPTAGDSDLR